MSGLLHREKYFCWLFLVVSAFPVSTASHSLQYLYTAISPGLDFPNFTTVGLLDGEQFVYYDSIIRKKIPKTEWMEKNEGEEYWREETATSQHHQENFKTDLTNLMQRFNQTAGIHTVQLMYGCELGDDGSVRGYWQYGYDGEDFLSLDLKTGTWTAANAKAVTTKHKADEDKYLAAGVKAYLENECIEWLEKYVGFGRDTLERKVPPEVDLFPKDSSSPVVCHATGFYPKPVMISWKKNGEDLDEGVELRETLPNQDGTFQKRSILSVSPEELDKHTYTCVIQHSSLEKEMALQVSDRRALSGGGSIGIIIGAVVAVLLLVAIGCVGVIIWKKRPNGFSSVSGNCNASSHRDSSSSNL